VKSENADHAALQHISMLTDSVGTKKIQNGLKDYREFKIAVTIQVGMILTQRMQSTSQRLQRIFLTLRAWRSCPLLALREIYLNNYFERLNKEFKIAIDF